MVEPTNYLYRSEHHREEELIKELEYVKLKQRLQ